MKAVLYLRMSLDKTGDEAGVTRQREDCIELAKRRGWDVVAEFVDNDTSAAGKVKRPDFEKLMAAMAGGSIDVVIAWNLDRLTRNRPDTLRLIELGQEQQLVIALARGSDLDMSTPMGRMMADQLAGWARYEIEQKSDRHKRANEQRAQAGLPHAGRRAYGYDFDGMTIIEDEALVLKEIAHRFLNGHSYNEIVYWLNRSGHRTTMGNCFYTIAIRQMLQRKRYVGIREHGGIDYPAQWTPIFDEDTFLRIQHEIRRRSESVIDRPKSRKYLLTGLLFCGECGHPMNGSNARDHRTREFRKVYRCRSQSKTGIGEAGCGKVTRGAIPLEWWLKELICYRLDTPALGELVKPGDTSTGELLKQKAAHEARLTELLDDYTDNLLSRTEYARAKKRVQGQLEATEREIERLHYNRTLGGLVAAGESVRARWEAETEGWRRQLIELLVERVDVRSGRKLPRVEIEGKTFYFDSSLIDVTWRA